MHSVAEQRDDFAASKTLSDCNLQNMYREHTPVACIMNSTVLSQAQITFALVAQELNGPGLQRHHWAHENSSVIWSAMSSPCWSLPHLLTSSLPQHEAQPGLHDLLQDDTVHRAPLPEPCQSKSSANGPLSHVNYEGGRNPRNTSPAGDEPKELAIISGSSPEDI